MLAYCCGYHVDGGWEDFPKIGNLLACPLSKTATSRILIIYSVRMICGRPWAGCFYSINAQVKYFAIECSGN